MGEAWKMPWCHWHMRTSDAGWVCTCHLAEGFVPKCGYKPSDINQDIGKPQKNPQPNADGVCRDYTPPDILESMEAGAEDWAVDNIRGDEFRCSRCEKWVPLTDMNPGGPGPYSLPICGTCLEEELCKIEETPCE